MSKSRSRRASPLATAVRKFFVSGFVVFSFVAYAIHDRLINADPSNINSAASTSGTQTQLINSSAQVLPTSQPIVPISQQIVSTSPASMPATNVPNLASTTALMPTNTLIVPTSTPIPPTMTPVPPTDTPQSQGQYKDGTYTGPSVDAFYGQVQVQITVQDGKLTNVQFLDYPHDRRTSQMINSQAMPWLTQEAIQAQSAYVNIISGATLTSQAFAQSLYTALNQAVN